MNRGKAFHIIRVQSLELLKKDLTAEIQKVVEPYLLSTGNILAELPSKEIDKLQKSGKHESGKRGEVLFRQGGFPKGVIWILSGKVKIYQETESGERQTTYIYSDGDLIGYRQLIAEARHPVSAMLLEDSTFIFIPAASFRALLNESIFFTRSVLNALAGEFTVWMNRMTLFMQFPVRQRLILSLLILHELYCSSDPERNEITITRTDLAEYVGATLETVVRSLNALKGQNMVNVQGRRIMLVDLEKLMRSHKDFVLKTK